MNGLKIYCCYHNKEDYKEDGNTWVYGPDYLLNPLLSEFSMYHYIWKNDIDSKYIGVCHYARPIYENDLKGRRIDFKSAVIYTKFETPEMVYGLRKWSRNTWFQCEWLYDLYVEYVTKKYGKINQFLNIENKYGLTINFGVRRASFVSTRQHFMDLCDYIFGFLDFIDKRYKLNYNYNRYLKFIYIKWFDKTNGQLPYMYIDPQHIRRFFSYVFEKMVSIYLQSNLPNLSVLYQNK